MKETLDLYAILKVGKTARKETIVKAFRKLAKKVHPDCGGNREDFERIQFAYDVLSDDAKRARYDATGEYADGKPNNDIGETMSILGGYYIQALTAILSQGRKPHQIDICDMIKSGLKGKSAEIKKGMDEPKKRLAALQQVVGRWSTKGEFNLMEQATIQMVQEIENKLREGQRMIDRLKSAEDFLGQYTYRHDKEDVKEYSIAQLFINGQRVDGAKFSWNV